MKRIMQVELGCISTIQNLFICSHTLYPFECPYLPYDSCLIIQDRALAYEDLDSFIFYQFNSILAAKYL